MVDIIGESLAPSRYVLSNNVGIAAGLAWELKRNDIIMYDKQGELKYGLDWPDAKNGFVSQSEFASWLAAHRRGRTGIAGAADGQRRKHGRFTSTET